MFYGSRCSPLETVSGKALGRWSERQRAQPCQQQPGKGLNPVPLLAHIIQHWDSTLHQQNGFKPMKYNNDKIQLFFSSFLFISEALWVSDAMIWRGYISFWRRKTFIYFRSMWFNRLPCLQDQSFEEDEKRARTSTDQAAAAQRTHSFFPHPAIFIHWGERPKSLLTKLAFVISCPASKSELSHSPVLMFPRKMD